MPPIAVNTIAFGQGMSATGIQTVVAMAAIANGGVILRPYLVQSVIGSDGTVLLSGAARRSGGCSRRTRPGR